MDRFVKKYFWRFVHELNTEWLGLVRYCATVDIYIPLLHVWLLTVIARLLQNFHWTFQEDNAPFRISGFKFVEKASGINTLSRSPYSSNMWDNLLHISYILWMYLLLWRGSSSTLGRKYELWKYISLPTVDSRLLSLTLQNSQWTFQKDIAPCRISLDSNSWKRQAASTLYSGSHMARILIFIKNVYKLLKIQFKRKVNLVWNASEMERDDMYSPLPLHYIGSLIMYICQKWIRSVYLSLFGLRL